MTKKTVDTIRFALNFLNCVNAAITSLSTNSERVSRAVADMSADTQALKEFEEFVKNA